MVWRMTASPEITPLEIRQSAPRVLSIRWADGVESEYAVRSLRLACACAQAVSTLTN